MADLTPGADAEWKPMTDWSGLPDVYVTKAECQQGMFWRIEACSVPMAIGPEVRLVPAHKLTGASALDGDAFAKLIREAEARVWDNAITLLLRLRGPTDVPRTRKAIWFDEGIERSIEELRDAATRKEEG